MLWLVLFLGVAGAVVARQSSALAASRRVRALREQRLTLEARRADLERRIRVGSSRQELVPRVERLGLRQPPDSAQILFSVPLREER